MSRTLSNKHGPDHIYHKFEVKKVSTGEILGKDGEFIFVLRPETDEAAIAALHTYAMVCKQKGYLVLSNEILDSLGYPIDESI
jgi:hypothetical protein